MLRLAYVKPTVKILKLFIWISVLSVHYMTIDIDVIQKKLYFSAFSENNGWFCDIWSNQSTPRKQFATHSWVSLHSLQILVV